MVDPIAERHVAVRRARDIGDVRVTPVALVAVAEAQMSATSAPAGMVVP